MNVDQIVNSRLLYPPRTCMVSITFRRDDDVLSEIAGRKGRYANGGFVRRHSSRRRGETIARPVPIVREGHQNV